MKSTKCVLLRQCKIFFCTLDFLLLIKTATETVDILVVITSRYNFFLLEMVTFLGLEHSLISLDTGIFGPHFLISQRNIVNYLNSFHAGGKNIE